MPIVVPTLLKHALCTDLVQSANSLLAFDVVLIVSKYFKPAKEKHREHRLQCYRYLIKNVQCAKNKQRKTENRNDNRIMNRAGPMYKRQYNVTYPQS